MRGATALRHEWAREQMSCALRTARLTAVPSFGDRATNAPRSVARSLRALFRDALRNETFNETCNKRDHNNRSSYTWLVLLGKTGPWVGGRGAATALAAARWRHHSRAFPPGPSPSRCCSACCCGRPAVSASARDGTLPTTPDGTSAPTGWPAGRKGCQPWTRMGSLGRLSRRWMAAGLWSARGSQTAAASSTATCGYSTSPTTLQCRLSLP